jgi:tetratricopeptide (TPR) repeat protein/two-component sensor histidine kinase
VAERPRRLAGEESARRELARALHDDHGQRVAALGFELRAVRNKLAQDDPRRIQLDGLSQRLSELGEDLRLLSHELHPAVLERRGLAEALRDAGAEIEARQGVRVELDFEGIERPIPPEVALALYRIAQEGLVNAARHAGSRRVRLVLRVGAVVRLSMSDDGAGFDLAAARRGGGLGLTSMEERARLLGGRCRFVTAPGAGTRLEVSVPRHRLGRWLRRRWGWVTAVALVVLALAGGLVATQLQARQTAAEARRSEAAVHFLESLFTAADPRQTPGEVLDARALLQRGSDRLNEELGEEPLLRARLLDTLGGIYTNLGLYGEARPKLEAALALRRGLLGDAHPEVAATLTRLGSLAHLSGEGDAEELYRRALAIREAQAGREPAELADLLNKLGVAVAAKGRLDEAEEFLYRSLALHEELYGAQDLRVAKMLHNLSGVAYYRGDPDAAEALVGRALAIREAQLGEDDLDLAGSREALALMLRDQGRHAEAVALLERVAEAVERVYGPDHPELARTLLNLGLTRSALGDDPAARALFERALGIEEQTLAPDQRLLVRTLAALAAQHLDLRRYSEAEPLYRRLLALHEQGAVYGAWDQVLAEWQELRAAKGAS